MRFECRWAGSRWRRLVVPALAVAALLANGASAAAEAEKKPEAKAEAKSAKTEAEDLEKQLRAAQKKLEEAAREVARLSSQQSEWVWQNGRFGRARERAVLGVSIGDADRDDGVPVLSVSPGGPAEAAGIKSGDVLTQIAAKPLNSSGGTSPRDKLFTTLRETKPGDKVAVSYRRDGKVATATVTTDSIRDRFVTVNVPSPGQLQNLEHLPHFAFSRADGVFGSTELAPLTPKLGQYFGAEKGLLVVRGPSDSRLQLEEGDVILDIDGRVPSDTSHALRILGSYQAGEKMKVNVMRMKKRMSFEITIPEETGRRGYRYEVTPAPAAVKIPVPPVAPAPAPVPRPGAAVDGTI